MQFLRIVSPFYFVVSCKLVSDGVLRGAGLMKEFMVATFTDLILRVGLAIGLSKVLGVTGVWCAWPIGWTIAMVMSVLFYRRGRGRSRRLNFLKRFPSGRRFFDSFRHDFVVPPPSKREAFGMRFRKNKPHF